MENNKNTKIYVVVEFVFKGKIFVSAAPKKWINGSQCCWPKKDKESRAIKENQDPTDDWTTIDNVKVLGEYSTFKEAKYYEQRFAKTDDESDCHQNNTVENRKCKLNSKYRDPSVSPPPSLSLDSENYTDHSSFDDGVIYTSEITDSGKCSGPQSLPSTSMSSVTELTSIIPNIDKVDTQTFENLVNKAPIIFENTIRNEAPIIFENTISDHMEVKNEILQSTLYISGKLVIIENRIQNIENVLNTSFSAVNSTRSPNNISKLLPLKSIDKLQELEILLDEEYNKQQLLQALQYIGGSSEKSCVARCLERLFTNHCAMFCSWTGKKDNFKIKHLKSIQILKDAVRNIYPYSKDNIFEKNVMIWLQFAKTRFLRGKE